MQRLLNRALTHLGTKEVPGEQSNPEILGWLKRFGKNLKKWATGRDETAWCAVFVSAVLAEEGFKGTDHALASSYIKWGEPSLPVPGAVVVIKHKAGKDERTGSTGGYHVGFLVELQKHYIVIVGGNQSNQVKKSYFPRHKYAIVEMRKPSGLGLLPSHV
jgi:uncharacterized protein (TIGR02594 family)